MSAIYLFWECSKLDHIFSRSANQRSPSTQKIIIVSPVHCAGIAVFSKYLPFAEKAVHLIKYVLQISQIHRKLTSLRFTIFGVLILLNCLIYTYLLHRVGTIFSSFYQMMSNYSHFSSNIFICSCDPLKCYLSLLGGVELQVVKVTHYSRNVLELKHKYSLDSSVETFSVG